MRFTGLTFLTQRSIRFAALAIFLFSTGLSSCSSSLEDELTPVETKDNLVGDVKTPGKPSGEDSSAGGEGSSTPDGGDEDAGNDTEKGEPGSNGGETPGSSTPESPATPTAPVPPAVTQPKPSASTVLKNVFDFPVGAAVVKELLENPQYGNTVAREFSRVTSESDFKWGNVHPSKDKYTFAKADAVVAFAEKHNMKVHGHTLVWSHATNEPKWVKEFQGDKAAWEQLLKDHIITVMRHFKGRVQSWDVVNEPVKEGGVYTNSIWYRKLGKDWVIKAFKYAQEADPQAKLFLNDYGQEFGGKKMKELLNIVDEAKKQGITIHGMGFQLHTILRIDTKLITNNLKLAADKGLLIHISELDISVKYGMPKTFALTAELEKAQGVKYYEIVSGYMKVVPKHLQWGITTWGVSDKTSYFNKGYANSDHDYPLLFDRNYKPKEAYYGFLNAGLGK